MKYRQATGTSDATAYVSAAAALVRSKFPDLTAGQVANRLTKTAITPDGKSGISSPDPKYGYGVIRPYRPSRRTFLPGRGTGRSPCRRRRRLLPGQVWMFQGARLRGVRVMRRAA
ncbi:S8 family serine peptidase [Streptomyces platensis]|uniref:S8 family serine peptidase n=1 Tax=Streptomyces platensis TaxID=58346 RepID=UPI00386DB932